MHTVTCPGLSARSDRHRVANWGRHRSPPQTHGHVLLPLLPPGGSASRPIFQIPGLGWSGEEALGGSGCGRRAGDRTERGPSLPCPEALCLAGAHGLRRLLPGPPAPRKPHVSSSDVVGVTKTGQGLITARPRTCQGGVRGAPCGCSLDSEPSATRDTRDWTPARRGPGDGGRERVPGPVRQDPSIHPTLDTHQQSAHGLPKPAARERTVPLPRGGRGQPRRTHTKRQLQRGTAVTSTDDATRGEGQLCVAG